MRINKIREVAERFMFAWLTSDAGVIAPYYDAAMALGTVAENCNPITSDMHRRLYRMAQVLLDEVKAERQEAADEAK